MPDTKKISVTDLNVNTDNYRYEPVKSEKEAVDTMIQDQGDNLYNLAKHILEHGLDPTQTILVTPSNTDKTKFNVLEGNRRTVVLKLLLNPDRIDDPGKNLLKTKFKKLQAENESKLIKEVTCLVFESPQEAEKWIKLKHTGPNEGVGVVGWNAAQKDRFEEKVENKTSLYLQTIEILKNSKYVLPDIKNRLNEVPPSNLERLISDPDVRTFLGLDFKQGKLSFAISEEEIAKGMVHIIEDLLKPDFNVNNIYYKQDRERYIQTFPPAAIPDTTKVAKPSEPPKPSQPAKPAKAQKPTPKERSVLIPPKCSIKISNSKVNRIYHELQMLKVEKFTNAAAVLLRVFVELSVDCYLTKHKMPRVDSKGRYCSLKDKVETVAKSLEPKKPEYKEICKGIRTAINNKNDLLGTDTLHAYVHNAHFSPTPKNLTIAWDNVEGFIIAIWENI